MSVPICIRCLMVDGHQVRLLPMPAENPQLWRCVGCGWEGDYPPRTPAEQREPTFDEWAAQTDRMEEQIRLRREGLVAVGNRLMQGKDRGLEDGSYETRKAGRWR